MPRKPERRLVGVGVSKTTTSGCRAFKVRVRQHQHRGNASASARQKWLYVLHPRKGVSPVTSLMSNSAGQGVCPVGVHVKDMRRVGRQSSCTTLVGVSRVTPIVAEYMAGRSLGNGEIYTPLTVRSTLLNFARSGIRSAQTRSQTRMKDRVSKVDSS